MPPKNQSDLQSEQLAARGFELLQKLLCEQYGYLTPLICGFEGKADDMVGTIGTDGRTVYYDPAWLLRHLADVEELEQLKQTYLHMLAHCVLGHIWQTAKGDTRLWDEAFDFVAETLRRRIAPDGMCPRKNGYSQKLLDRLDLVTPEALTRLCRQYQPRKQLDMLAEKLRRDEHSCWRRNEKKRRSEKKKGTLGAAEAENADADYWKQLLESAYAMLTDRVAEGIRQGMSLADFGQSIMAAEENESDYRALLRKYSRIREQKQEDTESLDCAWYTLGLALYGNVPLIEYPESAEKPHVDDIVIAVDVSGSCSGQVAARFLRETCNMIRNMDIGGEANIRILECDMTIRRETVIRREDDIPDFSVRRVRGFSGTDFRPVFQHIEALRQSCEIQKPRCLLYLSDGWGGFPEKASDYDTVFVLTEEGYASRNRIPRWVQTVFLTEKDLKGESI